VYPETVVVTGKEVDTVHHEEAPAPEGRFARTMSYISNIYCFCIVLLAGVLKCAESFATTHSVRVDEFLLFLFVVGIIFVIYVFFYMELYKPSKVAETSNRWLKGAIVLFLICITAKAAMRTVEINKNQDAGCVEKPLHIAELWLFVVFAGLQVILVWRHGKVSITTNRILIRFGIMHVIATDISVWINEIAEETRVAIHAEQQIVPDCDKPFSLVTQSSCIALEQNRPANVDIKWTAADHHSQHGGHHVLELYAGCPCTMTECTAVHQADLLLFPFLAEFCLVISCLMYEVWERIAKHAHRHAEAVKPSYGLFGSIIGLVCGLITIIIAIILIGILAGGVTTGKYQLILRDVFMIVISLAMLGAILYGFKLFKPLAKCNEEEMALDMNLLVFCLTGPVLVALFAILAFNGATTTAHHQYVQDPALNLASHVISLIFRVIDAVACCTLVFFISSGFEHRGSTAGMSAAQRRPIRDICLFLVLANAALWFFLSMEGSAFGSLSHEYDFYGHLSWTVLTKLATPLEIFFRMHAAGCVFDIWCRM